MYWKICLKAYIKKNTNSITNYFTDALANIFVVRFNLRAYRWVQAMVFAIDEINKDNSLLPNISLGFSIFDCCDTIIKALQHTLSVVTGRPDLIVNYHCKSKSTMAGIIGSAGPVVYLPIARVLGFFSYPQISYISTVPYLSDRKQFPSFFRTIPSDVSQTQGIAQLLASFGWTWVGILAQGDDYGQAGSQSLKKDMDTVGACAAFEEIVPIYFAKETINHIINIIQNSLAHVIVVIYSDNYLSTVIEEISQKDISGKIWIATDGWSTSLSLAKPKFWGILGGTLGFAVPRGDIHGFKDFLYGIHPSTSPEDIFIQQFWETAFNCRWPGPDTDRKEMDKKLCSGKESLEALKNIYTDVSNLRITYNVFHSVYAFAQALNDLYTCQPGKGPFINGTCTDISDFYPWQLLYYVKNVHFKTKSGDDVYFDDGGNPPGRYDIINWQLNLEGSAVFTKVGRFDSAAPPQQLIINSSAILWKAGEIQVPQSVCSESCPIGHRKAARQGQAICCFDCIPCPSGEIANQTGSTICLRCTDDFWPTEKQDECIPKLTEFLSFEEPLGSLLATTALFIALLAATTLFLFIKHSDTPIVKANNNQLSYLLLIALILCPLSSLIFIGQPMKLTCMCRQVTFGIIFALCVSCVLAKTIMVVVAFRATKPNSNLRKWIGPGLSNSVVFSGTFVQVIVCFVWLLSAPPFPEQDLTSEPGKKILKCNEGSPIAFWCMLGYIGLLAIISFVVAFLARKLPDAFNEAAFITFSMLMFVSVWLSFIPAYISTKGKYMVAVEIFAILSSSVGLLLCIFFPKCYIILFRPHTNTREYLMGRGTTRSVHTSTVACSTSTTVHLEKDQQNQRWDSIPRTSLLGGSRENILQDHGTKTGPAPGGQIDFAMSDKALGSSVNILEIFLEGSDGALEEEDLFPDLSDLEDGDWSDFDEPEPFVSCFPETFALPFLTLFVLVCLQPQKGMQKTEITPGELGTIL
ncbi:vomeronasal type-2 receptor 1-like [Protopterus annectens]|uniref:vomeronasal type-2 receptor 1-like n=1 Tax=Protopterus annectens TaxID=7888 RepID=UPI001CFB58BF|nr:vomeronasal type-2 receptor 1-like [Protopterus annectens]